MADFMRNRTSQNPSGQMRWVILLLVIAVILPTVCLLWFMNQAVKNERLAVRQKLIDVYTKRANTFFVDYPDSYWNGTEAHLGSSEDVLFKYTWMFPQVFAGQNYKRFSGFVIYDEDLQEVWPILQNPDIADSALTESLRKATKLEFQLGDISEALTEYHKLTSEPNDLGIQLAAGTAEVRCLCKLNRLTEAVEKCYQLSYPTVEDVNNHPYAAQIMRMRVRLAQLYQDTNDPNLYYHLRRCLTGAHYRGEKESPGMHFPSSVNIWGLTKLSEITIQAGFDEKLEQELAEAQESINIETASSLASEYYNNINFALDWPKETIRKLDLPQSPYGIYYRILGKTILCLISDEFIGWFADIAVNDWTDNTVVCRITDDKGNFIAGYEEIEDKPFAAISMGRFLPEWTAQLYFRDSGVFENAASKQTNIYLWTGMLVVVLILAAGGFATQAVGKQIRLNRLKNDFIATVTHELKTPLSSMRVLVDTLLDGNYEGEKTATEYLQLVAKENERLSRLIDNFLTFSRMERNKQAFDMVRVNPAEIAETAAEAVKTKFGKGKCKFDVSIGENLPDVSADKDAMVTVLMNLLDNAYKYSCDDKQIELNVFAEDSAVCFSVKDNGIGMSRRAVKKVFNRFYQVDSSLSRRTEGTGLGLSIVKFIVDAHKGTITIDSKPDEGSEFALKLPTATIKKGLANEYNR